MKDFKNFEAGLGSELQVVNGVLLRRGKLSMFGPANPAEVQEIKLQRDVVIEVLSRYHKWLSDPTMQ